MKTSFTTMIDQLRKILTENGVNPMSFSLDGYAEDRICLEQTRCGWDVYHAYMGDKNIMSHHESFTSAAMDIADRVVDNMPAYRKVIAGISEIKDEASPEKQLRTNKISLAKALATLRSEALPHKKPSSISLPNYRPYTKRSTISGSRRRSRERTTINTPFSKPFVSQREISPSRYSGNSLAARTTKEVRVAKKKSGQLSLDIKEKTNHFMK